MSRSGGRLTAFVLAGGGSLGAVEVGMLQALLEVGIRPDLVVGASVGAINGVHFAASPDAAGVARLAEVWRRVGRGDVFPVSAVRGLRVLLGRGESLVSPRALRRVLDENLPCDTLERAVCPVHVVATELVSGEEVLLSRGPAVEAVLASAAIPAVFPPVTVNGRRLIDGGIANNTPLTTALQLGARRLIVLPTGFSCRADPVPRSPIDVALHSLNLLIARQLVRDAERLQEPEQLHVVPPLCPLARSAYDFSGTEELIERAAASTRRWLEAGGLERGGVPGSLRPHAH